MTDTHLNPTGALSELDRLGQAALDAIYKESKIRSREIVAALKDKSDPSVDPITKIQEVTGGTSKEEAITSILDMMRLSQEREVAVAAYTSIRRSFEAAGLV